MGHLRPALRTLAVLVFIFLGMQAASAAQSVLKVNVQSDLMNIDPIWTTAYITRNHGYMVFDTLFAMDAELEVRPQMAEGHTLSADAKTYTITLREGLQWHDGRPVTPADCIQSIKRWGARDSMGQQLLAQVSAMEVVDDRRFRIHLKAPWGLTLAALGKMSSNVPFMMPERLAKTDPFEQIAEAIGSGPFAFVKAEWRPGAKVVYRRNADYRPRSEPANGAAGGKIVHFDRVEWLYIPDQNTAMNALIVGEIDYIESPSPDFLPILRQADGVKLKIIDPRGSQGWLRINHLLPPFDKLKARQALQYMVDQETYLLAMVGDPTLFRICPAMFVCDTPYASDVGAVRLMAKDPVKAKALLKASGYDGGKVVLLHATDGTHSSPATLVTAQLMRDIGINVEVQAMDWSTLTARRAKKKPLAEGGWSVFHTSWSSLDLINPAANIGVSGGCQAKAWFGWPCDEKIEDLRRAFSAEPDGAKRKALAEQVQARAMEIVTYIPIGQYTSPIAYRADLTGVLEAPVPLFWNIKRR
jgi:peptide/nickel transport system substrate-binding protein